MKKLVILLLALALAYPFGLAFAEEKESLESLQKDRRIIVLEIVARQSAMQTNQEIMKRLNQEIAVWREQLTRIDEEIKEVKEQEKKEIKPKEK